MPICYLSAMTPWTDRSGRLSALKIATLALSIAPGMLLLVAFWRSQLGPMPVKEMIHETGDWAVRLLLICLAVTPAMRIFMWPRLALIRRMLGIAAFAYALCHLALFVVDSKYDLVFVGKEIALRIYLTIGFATLLGLSALAATSTDAAVRRLGRRWKALHSIIYGLAALAILHFFMQSKIDASEAALMAGFFSLLMIYRLVAARRIAFKPINLIACAILGALATAGLEALWYGLATGIAPLRVLAANLMIGFGLRPAVIVLLVGAVIAVLKFLQPLVTRLLRPPLPRRSESTI